MTNQSSNYAIAFTVFYILKRSHYLLSTKKQIIYRYCRQGNYRLYKIPPPGRCTNSLGWMPLLKK
ncbi:hypothetical protein [Nostoc sp.]|uniref:hypothetical protein n=1 Tax=Nostoc sp. TaxID=1180 RepID=UPI002FF758F5